MSAHRVSLDNQSFAAISLGKNTIDPRPHGKKLQQLEVGDEIVFIDDSRPWRSLRAKVTELLNDKLCVAEITFEVIVENSVKKHSAGGVIIKDGKVLTISWTSHDYVAFPKGGLEEGETSEQAAVREVHEETGYEAEIVEFIGSWTYRYILDGTLTEKTADYYLMKLTSESTPKPARQPGEDFENLWIDIGVARDRLTLEDSKQVFDRAVSIKKSILTTYL